MRLILFIILFALNLSLQGGNFLKSEFMEMPDFHNENVFDKKHTIVLHGDYHSFSNALKHNINYSILFNRFLDEDEKSVTANDLKESNPFKLNWNFGATYFYQPQKSFLFDKSILGIGFKNVQDFRGVFSEDAVNLALYGNKSFEDKTAFIGPGNFEQRVFNEWQLFYGGTKEINESFTFFTGIKGSLLQGLQYISVDVEKAELFTAPLGESLTLDYDFSMIENSDQGIHPGIWNGFGMDFTLNAGVKTTDYYVSATVSGLGFINWKDNSRLQADTIIDFQGIFVPQIFDLDNPDFFNDYIDSVNNTYFPQSELSNHRSANPTVIDLRGGHSSWEFFALSGGVQYRSSFKNSGIFWAGASYQPVSKLNIHKSFAFSTMSGYLSGLEVEFSSPNFLISVGSNSINGLLFSNHFSSGSAYLKSTIKF
ncbi:MAG: hypothetical protein EA412_02115 [Chitinophagaceae bacterium]|nr:MAG: hypothetical protein EA412_02115 [Chitinophagaceae bacterium]